MCSQSHNHLYSLSWAYGLWCHPHLGNCRDMHYSDSGKTQLFSSQDDGAQGEKCVVRRGGREAVIMQHGDESSLCVMM